MTEERRRPFSSLAFRIYLVGLAQFAVVAAGLFTILEISRPRMNPREDEARFIAAQLESNLDDRSRLDAQLLAIERDLHASAVIIDAKGIVIGATSDAGIPRCPPRREPAPELTDRHFGCFTSALHFPDGSTGELRIGASGPAPPPSIGPRLIAIVLLVVGVSSWLLARSLTHPLRRLSKTASAFGEGDLSARVGLARRDELGDVARAFDDMGDRLNELLRAEKELLANVSHELRTPLARIRVAVDIASEGDAEVAREVLGDIASDLAELERLISDTLTAARLDLAHAAPTGGIPPLRMERVDPGIILSRAVEKFRGAHPERALHVDVASDLPEIDADEVLLRRAVDNLLENAHKYTEDAGRSVRLRASGSEGLEIAVVDEGVGISAADLPNVFRPFFRADKSRTRTTGGLGLGLALTKRIVEAHGGSLVLESEPHRGTTAKIRIPLPSSQSQTS